MRENGGVQTCPACRAENPSGFRFCGSCGTSLGAVTCPSCGAIATDGQRFCGSCGSPITANETGTGASGPTGASASAAPAALDERKLATVLFADVVGFTSLAERADHETVARTVDAAFRQLAQIVAEHGGTVDKYMGDSLMAVFGVPQAHDDDAERAVAAALAMRGVGGDLAFSIGVNSGEVMVTAVGRDGEVTVIGDTVNVAARLEKAAGAGEVLVGRMTAELAGERVVLRERQPVVLKGKRDPVDVWEAVALRSPADGAPAPCAGAPLLGRDDELAFLRAQWRRAVRDRRASVVLVVGEAGVGKTRLVEELVSELTCAGSGVSGEGDVTVARTTYPAYGGLGGPRVAAEIVRQLGSVGDTEIDARVRSLAGELHPSLRSIDPNAMHQEQLWALRRLLERKAEERPLLLAIDDIHRSGDKTLDLLAELMVRVVDVPLLLVLSGRPEPADWLTRFPSATTVRLGALGPSDATALADALVPDGPLHEDAARELVERAGGNPLYLRELVAMLRRREGFVLDDDGNLRLAGGITLPPSLHAILAARLDALAPAEKAALQHVAVLGDAATEQQVAALGLDGPRPALGALAVAGLLRHGESGGYDIVDPLLREVAYETLPRNVRGERHRRAADVVPTVLERARHLERASSYLPDDDELRARAADALGRAGLELLDAHRRPDAESILGRAVELGWRDPAGLLRLTRVFVDVGRPDLAFPIIELVPTETGDAELDVERVHTFATLVGTADRNAEAIELYDEARRRWHDLGRTDKEAWAYANAGVALFFAGRAAEASASLHEALRMFRVIDDRLGQMAVFRFLGIIHPEDPDVGEWLAEGLRHAEDVGDRTGQLGSVVALTWHHSFRSRWGGPDEIAEALAAAGRMYDLAGELGVTENQFYALAITSNLARLAGLLDDALDCATRATTYATGDRDATHAMSDAALFVAEVAMDGADGERPAPPLPAESPDPIVALSRIMEVEALALAGRFDEGAALLETFGGTPGSGAIDEVLGLVQELGLVLLGRPAEAGPGLTSALRAAEAVRAVPAAVAARALLAEVAAAAGDRARAEALVAEAAGPEVAGLAGALVLRARAVLGDAVARERLGLAASRLVAPGLLAGL
jgi:class 3 adenylate cyclase/tetratricopeptide (TPR) repeat protein